MRDLILQGGRITISLRQSSGYGAQGAGTGLAGRASLAGLASLLQ